MIACITLLCIANMYKYKEWSAFCSSGGGLAVFASATGPRMNSWLLLSQNRWRTDIFHKVDVSLPYHVHAAGIS
jgi:hypothetical protein